MVLRRAILETVRLPIMLEPTPRDRRVVLEHDQPVFVHRLLKNSPLRLERYERLDVVAHDPREREVGVRRNEIAQVESALPRRLDEDALVIGGVARCRDHSQTLYDFLLAGYPLDFVRRF